MSICPNLLADHPAKAARVERSRIPASFFRTQTLPRAERFGAWRESVGVFLDARLDPRGDASGFAGDVESYLLDDIVISRPRANGQKFDRASARIGRDGMDHYMIQLFVRGGTDMALGRRTLSADRQLIGFDLGKIRANRGIERQIVGDVPFEIGADAPPRREAARRRRENRDPNGRWRTRPRS